VEWQSGGAEEWTSRELEKKERRKEVEWKRGRMKERRIGRAEE
jgi:hypothetical protein